MIISTQGDYQFNGSNESNIYNDDDHFIIDDTTVEGKIMAQLFISNTPLVTFEHDGVFVTSVSIVELEKPIEVEGKLIQLIKNVQNQWEYVYKDKPVNKEEELEKEVASLRTMIESLVGGVE